jgi:hypothetical protein
MTATTLFPVTAGDVALTTDEWYTPRWLFAAAGVTFDMDVCAPVDAGFRTCPARRYLTAVEDGLTYPWDGLIWCNPPYSNMRPWVDRLLNHPTWMALVPPTCNIWRGELTAVADALALVTIGAAKRNPGFGRPDGKQAGYPFTLELLGRGRACVEGVARAAAGDAYAMGAYHVRPETP